MAAKKYSSDWFSHHIENWDKFTWPIHGNENLKVLEIGSFEGRSAEYICKSITSHPTSVLICVDTWVGSDLYPEKESGELFSIFTSNMKDEIESKRVIPLRGSSTDILPMLLKDQKETFDMIYVDGCHERNIVYKDAVNSFQLLKKDGYLIFDDYLWGDSLVGIQRRRIPKDAIDYFMEKYAGQYKLLFKGHQVILQKI